MADPTEAAPPPAPIAAPSIVTHKDGPHPHKRKQNITVVLVLVGFTVVLIALAAFAMGPQWMAFWSYTPQEGDIVFQSMQATDLVEVIEKATKSDISQVGIVGKDQNGAWVVYEVYNNVQATPLRTFLFRGRGSGYLIYRLKSEEQTHVPAMVKYAQEQLGKPDDQKFDWGNDAYYGAELVYKAYAAASGGGSLGKLVTLGDLKSKALDKLMRNVDDDMVPVALEIITPVEVAKAKQLDLVTSYQLDAPK